MRSSAIAPLRQLRACRPGQIFPRSNVPRSGGRRAQSQVVYRPNGESYRYQNVRIQKSPPTRFGLLNQLVWTFAGAYLIYRYSPIRFEQGQETAGHARSHGNGQPPRQGQPGSGIEVDDEIDEDSIWMFIPMTWSTKLPREFYKGSDPEWTEFVNIAKDRPRLSRVVGELVQIVVKGTQQHPAVARRLGGDVKLGNTWLDTAFPDGPPQEYARWGIEIGDGYVAWSQERIGPDEQHRVTRALWPKPVFDSFWASAKVLAGINYRRAKQALGLSDKDPLAPEERFKAAVEMMNNRRAIRDRKHVGKAQTDPEGTPTAGALDQSAAPSKVQSGSKPDEGDLKLPLWRISQIPLPPVGTSALGKTDVPIATHIFHHTLSKGWAQKQLEPPRGAFVIQGLVEISGKHGRMLFDVRSFYDPHRNEHVVVQANLRQFRKWQQHPKGGK